MYAIVNGVVQSSWDLEQEREGEQQHKVVPMSRVQIRELAKQVDEELMEKL